jgi:Gram-negative bacterial TonB protein C-terminal
MNGLIDSYIYLMKLFITLLFLFLLSTGRLFSQPVNTDSLQSSINLDSVYSEVDIPAEHPKGKEARIRFIQKNIDGGIHIKNLAPHSIYKVRIACIIDANGKIIDLVPETSEGYGMEKEVMRVFNKMPFAPAIKNGFAVKSKIVFPVVFMSRNPNQ